MWETWVQSLRWEDFPGEGKGYHSSIPAWRVPWRVWSMGLQRVGHDWATFTFRYENIDIYRGVVINKEGMATYSSILAWRIPWTEEPGRIKVCGVAKSRTEPKQLSMRPHRHRHTHTSFLKWTLEAEPQVKHKAYSRPESHWLCQESVN